jgi:hypothetical protein
MIKKNLFISLFLSILLMLGSLSWTTRAIAAPLPNPVFLAQTPTQTNEPTKATQPADSATSPPALAVPQPGSSPTDNQQSDRVSATQERDEIEERSPQSNTPSGGPYDVKAIQEFYKSLYGS